MRGGFEGLSLFLLTNTGSQAGRQEKNHRKNVTDARERDREREKKERERDRVKREILA